MLDDYGDDDYGDDDDDEKKKDQTTIKRQLNQPKNCQLRD